MADSNTSKEYMETLHHEERNILEAAEITGTVERLSLENGFETASPSLEEKVNVHVTKEGIIEILKDWAKSKQLTYYLVEHDKDINPDSGKPTPRHYHIVIKFGNVTKKADIVKKFPLGYIENTRSLRASVQYLIHKNDADKYQYDWSDIETNDLDLSWAKVTTNTQSDVALTEVLLKIQKGELKEYQIPEIDSILWAKHRKIIENAFVHYTECVVMDKNRVIEVYFITGETGVGKTTFAKDLADSLTNPNSYCISSGSRDPLQDYKGEPVLILDDLRGDSFKLHDLLKLLDNNTRSSGNSRYKNKHFTGDFIIITSVKSLAQFYPETPYEEKLQLYRRIKFYIELEPEKIYFNSFFPVEKVFKPVRETVNYVKIKYPPVSPAMDERFFNAVESLGVKVVPSNGAYAPSVPAGNPYKCDAVPDISKTNKQEWIA